MTERDKDRQRLAHILEYCKKITIAAKVHALLPTIGESVFCFIIPSSEQPTNMLPQIILAELEGDEAFPRHGDQEIHDEGTDRNV